jgi:hypothetical protein
MAAASLLIIHRAGVPLVTQMRNRLHAIAGIEGEVFQRDARTRMSKFWITFNVEM